MHIPTDLPDAPRKRKRKKNCVQAKTKLPSAYGKAQTTAFERISCGICREGIADTLTRGSSDEYINSQDKNGKLLHQQDPHADRIPRIRRTKNPIMNAK